MKRFVIGLAATLAIPAMAVAQTANPPAAAGKASEQAVPEMKNLGGTDKLHPPQKAMDEATPAAPGKTDSSSGASSGEAGSAGSTSSSAPSNSSGSAPTK